MSHVKRDAENYDEAVERSEYLRAVTDQIGNYAAATIHETRGDRSISLCIFIGEVAPDGSSGISTYGNVDPFRMIAAFLVKQAADATIVTLKEDDNERTH